MNSGNFSLGALLKENRDEILRIANKYGAYNVRIFGSVARGDTKEDSDIDFLIDMEQGRSLLDLAGFEIDLGNLLNRKIDVVTEEGLSPYLKDRILAEAMPL